MNDDECYVSQLNAILRQNSSIIRRDYSLARKYQKCLTEIENANSILNAKKRERNDLTFKLKTSDHSINVLTQMISETDSKIERVKGEIDKVTQKIDRICREILTTSCSLSNDDELKILQRQMGLVLLNTIKYSKEIQGIQNGFDEPAAMESKQLYDQQWMEFRM